MSQKSSFSRRMHLFVCLSRFFLTLRCADIYVCYDDYCVFLSGVPSELSAGGMKRGVEKTPKCTHPMCSNVPAHPPKCTYPMYTNVPAHPNFIKGRRSTLGQASYPANINLLKGLQRIYMLVILMLTSLFQNLVCSFFKIL